MSRIDLDALREEVRLKGPRRVIVDASGRALPTERAIREYGLFPDFVFVRRDGWTLGAPLQFAALARDQGDWIDVFDV